MRAQLFPNVVIVGGGPAGLLAALLLGQRGVPTTVLEREADTPGGGLSTRSYSIVLKETRGIKALAAAGKGVVEAAKQHSLPRSAMIFLDGVTGAETILPKREEMMVFSRPGLVQFLEEELQKLSNDNTDDIVTIRKGVLVTSIKMNCDDKNNDDNTVISIHFKDKDNEKEEILTATHLIGADGKWSQVRQTFTDDQFLDTSFSIRTEPSFGISIMCPSVPEGLRSDGTYILKPIHADCNFYIIGAPIATGECSVSIVCYDETVEKYPWMEPPSSSQRGTTANTWANDATTNSNCENDDDEGDGDDDDDEGNDEGGGGFATATETTTLAEHLAQLLQDEAPYFYNAIGREVLNNARINRRVRWVESTSTSISTAAKNHCEGEEKNIISYASSNGRIVLIGDSAHAVTPSLGDGCNLALESAVELLIHSLSCPTNKNKEEDTNDVNHNVVTIEDLTEAFRRYGISRPPQVRPIQLRSAQSSRLPKKN
mmetsp:Transcript_1582/g.1913  ORF Transcript_1582/g.1913 Transcript_1582/m.1913 type:complete len:486 (+) Transcript_1582:111-1568(+)